MGEVKGQAVGGSYRYARFVPEECGNAQSRPLSRLAMLCSAAVRESGPGAALGAWPGESPNGRCLTRTPRGRNTPGAVVAAPGSVGASTSGRELAGYRGGRESCR